MVNDFGCKHSDKLQSFFEIEARGIDFINHWGVSVEFKESWAKDKSKMFFKLPWEQLDATDLIVFCIYDKEFYIHFSEPFLFNYNFNNSKRHCCVRYNIIKRDYFKKFESYEALKSFLEGYRHG